jgi:hypothetical protein
VQGAQELATLRKGQCLIQIHATLFSWITTAPADDVWLHNLYVRSASGSGQHVAISIVPVLKQSARIWLTAVTLQGSKQGYEGAAAGVYAEGVQCHQFSCLSAHAKDAVVVTRASCGAESAPHGTQR